MGRTKEYLMLLEIPQELINEQAFLEHERVFLNSSIEKKVKTIRKINKPFKTH